MLPSMRLKINLRVVVFVGVLFTAVVAYLLPFALDCVLVAGLLAGWGVSRLLESLS